MLATSMQVSGGVRSWGVYQAIPAHVLATLDPMNDSQAGQG